jgi:5-methylcytosine-specific restriction endonuclease McrA
MLAHLASHPECLVCGRTDAVQAHHIIPVQFCLALGRPELELDFRNLVTLCETGNGVLTDDHHLYVGHLGGFHAFNPEVRADA